MKMICLFLLLSCLTACGAVPMGFAQGALPGLIGWWPLNDGSGTSAADFSGNNRTLTLSNSPSWVSGIIGNALSFSGNNAAGRNATSMTGGWTALTVCCWVNSSTYTKSTISTPMALWNYGGGQGAFSLMINAPSGGGGFGNTNIAFQPAKQGDTTGANYCYVSNNFTLTQGAWHHIAAVFDGSQSVNSNNCKLYIDGTNQWPIVYVGAGWPISSLGSTTHPITIGTWSGLTRPMFGSVDDPRIYNRALAAWEIKRIYGGGYGCGN